jgi:hypothetical protein
MFQEYEKAGTDPFDAPIPGESLTADPSTPRAWEQPPQFTDVNEAAKEVFLSVTEGESYVDLMDGIRNKVPIDMIAQTILFRGYMLGKWSTDLMLLLAEPTIYILIALAEHNGITDYLVYAEEEEEEDEDDLIAVMEEDVNRMSGKARPSMAMAKVEGMLPDSLLSQIKTAPKPVAGE